MSLAKRLRRLDSRVFPSMRQPGETAEAFLRRVAQRRWPSDRAPYIDVQTALQEYFAEKDR